MTSTYVSTFYERLSRTEFYNNIRIYLHNKKIIKIKQIYLQERKAANNVGKPIWNKSISQNKFVLVIYTEAKKKKKKSLNNFSSCKCFFKFV